LHSSGKREIVRSHAAGSPRPLRRRCSPHGPFPRRAPTDTAPSAANAPYAPTNLPVDFVRQSIALLLNGNRVEQIHGRNSQQPTKQRLAATFTSILLLNPLLLCSDASHPSTVSDLHTNRNPARPSSRQDAGLCSEWCRCA